MASLKSGIDLGEGTDRQGQGRRRSQLRLARATARPAIWRSSSCAAPPASSSPTSPSRAMPTPTWRCRAATSSSCPTPIPGAVGPVRSGKVKAIGIADTIARPTCPTCRPSSSRALPGVVAVGWIGLSAPANVPAPILDRLNAEMQRILEGPEVVAKLKGLSLHARRRIARGVRALHRSRNRQMARRHPGGRRQDRLGDPFGESPLNAGSAALQSRSWDAEAQERAALERRAPSETRSRRRSPRAGSPW